MPRPPTQPPFLQAQFEEITRQHQKVQELKVQRMSRTHNLNAVRDARVRSATFGRGSDPRPLRGLPHSGIEVISSISQTEAPPTNSQAGASQYVEAMVQNLVRSSLTQFGVIPKETPNQSQAQSDTIDPETPQVEDISSGGEIFYSDQEDQSGTVVNEFLMAQEELDGYDSFTSPVANKMPLWKFAEQTPSGSQAQSKTKTATTQAQPVTSTLVRPACSSSG